MDTFHEDDVIKGFESDEDQLEYLASLMSDGEDDGTQLKTPGDEQKKSRTESKAFDKELDEITKSRKRKLSSESGKRVNKKKKEQVNDKTASLQVELEEMKKKMMKMEQLLKEKQPSAQPTNKGTTNKRDVNGRRLAHQPQCSNNVASSSVVNTSLKDNKNTIGNKTTGLGHKQQHDNAKQILASDKSVNEKECITEIYSGLRIRNPLVSSQTMKERMANRKMIRIPMVCSHVKDGDIAGEWVTIGVVVSKLPPKDTAKGGRYCILRISDLSSQSAVLALFLFDNACKVHWKLQTGDVIAVLSPSLRPDDRAESGGKYTLSLSNADKLMRMGSSRDFTTCGGIVKSTGKKCTNFAKKSEGGCCEYHISQEYRSRIASRMELQSGYGPTVSGMERLKKKMKHDNAFYGGDFLRASDDSGSIPKKKVKNRLFAPGAKEAAAYMSEELQKERQSNKPTAEESAVFKEMLKLQSSGARNFNHYRTKDRPTLSDDKPPDLLTMEFIQKQQDGNGSSGVHLPAVTPFLGRGLLPGTEVDLTSSLKPNMRTAKLKAIAAVQQNPIEREDPNAIKKQNTSDKIKESIAERAKGSAEHKENVSSEQDRNGKKRMNSEEIERIMNKKSSHSWEINEEEWAREEFYFRQLEIKEAMEEKMQKIEKLSVKVVTCKECGYTAEHASERCRKEGHKLVHKRAEKRFFNCSSCKTRIIAYDRYPKQACSTCGGNNFKKAGMFKERTGPKLDSEKLLLRGEEEKFLTSLR